MRTIYLFKTAVLILISAFSVSAQKVLTPAELVYPQLDSENSRWIFFSSACRPFGMVNLCPDTRTNGDWGSGYHYEVDTIRGFSHIHMNGGTEENPRYELGSPIFDQITVRLHPKYYPGKLLTIKTIGNSDKNRYILSADFNGKKIDELSLKHKDLVNGGVITLKMGDQKTSSK